MRSRRFAFPKKKPFLIVIANVRAGLTSKTTGNKIPKIFEVYRTNRKYMSVKNKWPQF